MINYAAIEKETDTSLAHQIRSLEYINIKAITAPNLVVELRAIEMALYTEQAVRQCLGNYWPVRENGFINGLHFDSLKY